jgi:hypothetical protein
LIVASEWFPKLSFFIAFFKNSFYLAPLNEDQLISDLIKTWQKHQK